MTGGVPRAAKSSSTGAACVLYSLALSHHPLQPYIAFEKRCTSAATTSFFKDRACVLFNLKSKRVGRMFTSGSGSERKNRLCCEDCNRAGQVSLTSDDCKDAALRIAVA